MKFHMKDENGQTGALRLLKMAAEDQASARSLIDSIRDASVSESQYNLDFLATIAAFAIDGWKKA